MDNLSQVIDHMVQSAALFKQLLAVPQGAVAPSIRNKALLRRLHISFISLYELLSLQSELPEEYREKSLEEIADYFISKQVLTADDKDAFILLGSIYTAIRWSKPGSSPHEEKIMEQVESLHEFIQRVASYHTSHYQAEHPKEASL